jgi:hypothetical protein
VVRPRQIAMYLAARLTGRSLPVIGRQFNRDHTTILHSARVIEWLIFQDDRVRDDVQLLSMRLLEGGAIPLAANVFPRPSISNPFRDPRPLFWTKARDAEVRQLWDDNSLSQTDIAKVMKVSRSAINKRALVLGLSAARTYRQPCNLHRDS